LLAAVYLWKALQHARARRLKAMMTTMTLITILDL